MQRDGNDRKSVMMFVSSMLIFGTIGIFRRYIPISSDFIAFSRGILGGLFLLCFMKLKQKTVREKLPAHTAIWLAVTGAVSSHIQLYRSGFRIAVFCIAVKRAS